MHRVTITHTFGTAFENIFYKQLNSISMNATRRKQLAKLVEQLESIMSDIDTIREQEQEAYDNMPDSIQESERGDRMSEIIDSIQYAYDNVSDAVDNINEAIEN